MRLLDEMQVVTKGFAGDQMGVAILADGRNASGVPACLRRQHRRGCELGLRGVPVNTGTPRSCIRAPTVRL